MARIPAGVQLGRSPVAGLRRALEAAILGAFLVVAAGGWSLLRLRATPESNPGSGVAAPGAANAATAGIGEAAAVSLGEAALLLSSEALGAARAGAVFETVRATAPAPVRVVGITIRPIGGGTAETAISARAPDSAAVARWIESLLRAPAVEAAEVISERRQRDGSLVVAITARVSSRIPSRPTAVGGPDPASEPPAAPRPGAAR